MFDDLPSWLFTPAQQKRMREDQERSDQQQAKRRMPLCVPWSDKTCWRPELNLQASSYKPLQLFPVKTSKNPDANALKRGQFVDSSSGKWRYCHKLWSRGMFLMTGQGEKRGDVMFDGDVIVPALYERDGHLYAPKPWMSLTPHEILSLRPGTRRSKGHTVIAGLGLGHQLIEVCARDKVKKVTLVELDRELVDFMMPALLPHLKKKVDVMVGDAWKVLPKLTADVALVDIFPSYGYRVYDYDRFQAACPNIQTFWLWGHR